MPDGTAIAAQTTSTLTGTISSLQTSGFTITLPGGKSSASIHTGASTVYLFGGPPKVGLVAQVTGTGTLSNFSALFLSLYTSSVPYIATSGTVVAATSYGFVLNAGAAHPQFPVVMNAKTATSGTLLAVGSVATLSGYGTSNSSIVASKIVASNPTPTPSPTPTPDPTPTPVPTPTATPTPVPTPTPTPGPISQKHVLTADYLGKPYGTTAVSPTQAAPYLSWAQVEWENADATSGAGIKTQEYADPNRTTAGDGDPFYTSDETTFAHDCYGNRVTVKYASGLTMYQMNIGASSMQTLFANYVARIASLGHYDAIWEDEPGPLSEEVYEPFSAMPCNYSDAEWESYGIALDQASSIPVIINGINLLDKKALSLALTLMTGSNTMGGNYEGCYSTTSHPKMYSWLWTDMENTQLQLENENKLFECQLRDTNAASSNTDARLFAYASFLLTYSPSSSVIWEEYATPSGFHVEPESGLVALQPLQATPATVSSLQTSGGTYARQYAQCYFRGTFVGACAVVVNPDPLYSHPFPLSGYTRSLTLTGGGVLDGGTVSTNGPAPPSTLGPEEAAIVFTPAVSSPQYLRTRKR